MTENDQRWHLVEKTAPIWAKKLEKNCQVETLEGVVTFEKGCFLCRGSHDELWGQTEKQLNRKYRPDPNAVKKDGWEKFIPIPGQCCALARQVTHDFFVDSLWGRLSGKAGDYLFKSVHGKKTDTEKPNTEQWIVDKKIFEDTYNLML